MRGVIGGVASAAMALALWAGLVRLFDLPRFILPGPEAVAAALWRDRLLLADHAATTLTEIGAGLVIGTLLGALLALVLALLPGLARGLHPVLIVSQTVPVFALAPILTLWLGYGMAAKIVMAVLIIFFPVSTGFLHGLRRTEPGWLALARVMGGSRWRILWHLRVPAALPDLAGGLRLAATYAPIGAVIGEWVGGSRGLGYLMLMANGRARTDLLFAALLVLVALTLALRAAADRLADRLTRHATGG